MSVFEEACYLSNQRWCASLPTELEEVTFSKQHQKRMNLLFDKMRNGRYHRFTRRATAALIAAIIAVSVTVTAFAVPATREFIIKRFFDHSQYSVVNGERTFVEGINIGYLPEGFEKTDEYSSEKGTILNYTYTSQSQWIEIGKMTLNTNLGFDTEMYNSVEIVHNGLTYIYSQSDSHAACIWNDGEYIYRLTSNLTKDELLEIAFSIQ